jgi:hypothetical protein
MTKSISWSLSNKITTVRKNISYVTAVFLILLYSAINIIILLHHEPWEDEAHAWLIARDLDIISIFKQMAYDGTPALWYMFLVPFAKTGLPYISEFILHLMIAVAAVTVFILYAPFSKLTKILFIFSYYMAYEYSIIARSYCLSILLLFLIATLYGKRFEHPLWYSFLIFLLFNTNAHSFFIASSLTILFAWESYRNKVHSSNGKISLFIMLLGGLLSFLQLLPRTDSINYGLLIGPSYLMPYVAIANAFFPWHSVFIMQGDQRLAMIIMSILIFFIIILSIVKKPSVLFILLLSFSGLFYIFTFIYPGNVRHHGFILIMLFFALWISRYYHESQKKLFSIISNFNLYKLSIASINICLALSLQFCLKIQYQEYNDLFSGAKEMAEFIKRNTLDNFIIVAHPAPQASALLPYLPGKQFWYAGIEDYGTFVAYNKQFLDGSTISNPEVISRMNTNFPQESNILLLSSKPLDFPESNDFTLLYKVDRAFGYNHEKYYLYKPAEENHNKW